MEEITTQKRFETLHTQMAKKLDLIAEYINKDMNEFAMIEIAALKEYLRLELPNIVEMIPGKLL